MREFIHPKLLEHVQSQAGARIRKGLWFGAGGSILAGAAIYVIGNAITAAPSLGAANALVARVGVPPARVDAHVPRSDDALLKQLNATAQAMAEVASLSTAEMARRRAEAAKTVSLITHIDTAVWSTQRTLLVTLNRTDGKDKAMIDEVCRILTQYEEMRFTRIQLESPTDSGLTVRWRLCE